MADDTISKTTECRFGFKCRDKDSRHPICTVVDANSEHFLLVSGDNDFNCTYRVTFGKGDLCSCPTHYGLHRRQHPCLNRTPMPGRGDSPDRCRHARGGEAMPQTVEEAVQILIDELPLNEKVTLADASTDEVGELTIGLGNYIRNAFGLASDNQELLRSCSEDAGCGVEHPDDAAAIILARLVRELVKTHKLRLV